MNVGDELKFKLDMTKGRSKEISTYLTLTSACSRSTNTFSESDSSASNLAYMDMC